MWRFNHTSKMWAQLAAVTKAGGGTCTATPSTESPTNWPGATSNMAYYYDRASRSFYMFAGGACHCSIACSGMSEGAASSMEALQVVLHISFRHLSTISRIHGLCLALQREYENVGASPQLSCAGGGLHGYREARSAQPRRSHLCG